MKRFFFVLGLAQRRARNAPARSAFVALGVGLGVGLMVAIRILNSAAASALGTNLMNLGTRIELSITREGIGLPVALATELETVGGVAAALPVIEGTVLASSGDEALTLLGLDLPHPRVNEAYAGLLQDHRFGPGGRDELILDNGVLVPEELAARMGLGMGSVLEVEGPRGRTPLTVAGLLRLSGIGRAVAEHLLVADLDAAARMLARSGHVDRVDVLADATVAREILVERLATAVPTGAVVGQPQEAFAARFQLATAFLRITSAVSVFGLIVGFFLIYNVLAAAIIAESGELGRLRIQGASRRDLITLLVTQSAVQGLPGIALGCVLGVAIAVVARQPFLHGLSNITQMGLRAELSQVSWPSVAFIALLGLPTAIAASWLAVHRRVAHAPLQAVRGASTPELAGSGLRLAQRASAGLLVAAIACIGLEIASSSAAFGMLAIGAVSALLVTGSAAVVLPAAEVVRPWLVRSRLASGSIVADGLARGWSRTAVTIAVFVLGIGTAIATATIFHSVESLILGVLRQQIRGDLVISSAFRPQGWLPAPLDHSVADDLRGAPGVKAVDTERMLPVTFRGATLTARAIEGSDRGRWLLVEGEETIGGAGDTVLVSRNFREHFGLGPGDALELAGPDGSHTFRIGGVVEDFLSPVGSVTMNRRQLEALSKEPLVNYVSVTAEPGFDLRRIADDVRARTRDRYRLRILTLREFLHDAESLIRQIFGFTHAVTATVLLIATVGLLQSIVSGALERRRVLSIARALGANARHLRSAFVVEGMTLGAIGGAMGLAAGLLLSFLWLRIHFRYLLGFSVPIDWPWSTYAITGCLAVAWPGLAVLAVARRLVRLPRTADLVAE